MSNSLQSSRQAIAPQVRRARDEEIEPALRYILAASGRYAGEDQVRELRQFVQQRNFPLANLWLGLRGEHTLLWAVLPIINPGRTALLLQPDQFTDKTQELTAGECIGSVCADCKSRGVHIAQALISPEQQELISLHESLGFERVADLQYLQISPRKAAPPMLPAGFRWVTYSPESHEMFSQAILQSYIDSLDCPGLNGRREIDDVIAGHQSGGEFDPGRWFVLCEGDSAIAVLLLNAVSHSGLELVYLGLAPRARRRGLGMLLMKQALSCAWSSSASRLTLAVDSQNAPALKLYYRNGMQRIASKTALVRDLRDDVAHQRA